MSNEDRALTRISIKIQGIYRDALAFLESRFEALQLTAVHAGIKPASRHMLHEAKMSAFHAFCERVGLSCVFSDYKMLSTSDDCDSDKMGFSNRSSRRYLLSDPRKGKLHVYLSQHAGTAEWIRDLEACKQGETGTCALEMGRKLGYPECCIRFYMEHVDRYNHDPIIPSIGEFAEYPFYNNYAMRCFGYELVDHFPCSGDCPETTEIGKENRKLLRRVDARHARACEKMLKVLVLFTQHEGVFFFHDYKIEDQCILFKKFGSSWRGSRVHRRLYDNGKFIVHHAHCVQIGRRVYDNDVVTMIYK